MNRTQHFAECGIHIRSDDMSQDGYIALTQEQDGDMCVKIFDGEKSASVEITAHCCRSPRTYEALVALMKAIQLDNTERPI